jgi:hypothetical protein
LARSRTLPCSSRLRRSAGAVTSSAWSRFARLGPGFDRAATRRPEHAQRLGGGASLLRRAQVSAGHDTPCGEFSINEVKLALPAAASPVGSADLADSVAVAEELTCEPSTVAAGAFVSPQAIGPELEDPAHNPRMARSR